MKARPFAFLGILIGFAIGISFLVIQRKQPTLSSTFSPLFQQLGKPIQSANRSITQLMPISDVDEGALGEEIRARFESSYPQEKLHKKKIENLIQHLTKDSAKGFQYTVFLISGPPNAFALPGGVLCVTEGMLTLASTDDELAAVLSHEIGHVERGHLFDLYRKQLLQRKLKTVSLETSTSDFIQNLGSLFFSKAQEDEADEYGFSLLVTKGYEPSAMADIFEKLLQLESSSEGVLHDFASTHPRTALRVEKFRQKASKWHAQHKNLSK